jgi:4-amino-4-deoxy-L-arabinose transferase-like glycosyltransferase
MVSRTVLRRAGLIALAVAVVLCFAGVFQHGLWTPDEPREAEVGREMLLAKFSAMPTLGGDKFLEKPPLGAWIAAASYGVFGVNDWAMRVPYALLAVGTAWIAYLMGRRAGGRLAGLCSALALLTTWQFSETSHKGVLDVALTFFVAAGHLAFLSLWKTGRRSQTPYVVLFVCAGLAFLTKSVIGPALMCAPPILAAAALRDWDYVKRVLPRAFVAATAGVVAFGLPWVLALARTEGGGWAAVRTCLVTNTIGRSVGGDDSGFGAHAKPWYQFYYFYTWITVLAPWCLAAPAAIKSGTLAKSWRGGRTAFCGLVFVAGLVLLSIPSGKRELYLVPLLPAFAVVPGVWLSRIRSRAARTDQPPPIDASPRMWDLVTVRILKFLALVAFLLIVVAMAYVALGGPIPESVDAFTRETIAVQKTAALVAMIAIGALVLGPRLWAKRRLVPATASGLDLAASLVTLFLIVHGLAFPLLDPLREMSLGARTVGSLVSPGRPIVAFHPDETTRAVVPFYTGREFVTVVTVKQALAALDAGATHLLVQDKDRGKLYPEQRTSPAKTPQAEENEKLTAALVARISLVETVRLNATRAVDVYEVRAK